MKNRDGFTLIELMIVVTIIGILAGVAVPAFQKYIMKSRTTEVMVNVRKIYDGQLAYYVDDHVLETGQLTTKTFVSATCSPWSRPTNQKRVGEWASGGWPQIKFAADSPIFYSYIAEVHPNDSPGYATPAWVPGFGYTPGADVSKGFLVRGFGDLDSDGDLSQYSRMGLVYVGTDEVEGGAGVYMLDPLE